MGKGEPIRVVIAGGWRGIAAAAVPAYARRDWPRWRASRCSERAK
jgi:hypothetical protein